MRIREFGFGCYLKPAKIDLNSADQRWLQGLMTYAPVDEDLQTKLVSAILDWRDADDL